MILHLLRHAKSSWDLPLDDVSRPLAERGLSAARQLAHHLTGAGVIPDLTLCSPARRARETLEAIRGALPPAMAVRVEDWLYQADASEIRSHLRRLPSRAAQVLVVGHNPALQVLALSLVPGSSLRPLGDKLPTCGLVSMRLPGATWRTLGAGPAELIGLWRPRSDSNRRSPP